MQLRPWFEEENYRSQPCYLEMTPTQQRWVDGFRRDGYLILDETGIPANTIEEVITGLAGKHSETGKLQGRLQDAWQCNEAVASIATAASVLEALRTVYQKEAVPFQTLNFSRGTQQRAHSDTIHFNSMPFGFMCGVWTALEDIDAGNGPLFYYPGSQRLPVFHMDELGLKSEASEYRKYEDCVARILSENGYRPRQAHLKKGQALVWSANIFHGGAKVLDPARTRLSQVTHYFFPGCIYYTPMLSNPPAQRWMLRQFKDIRTRELVPEYQGLRREPGKLTRLLGKIPLLKKRPKGK